MPYFIDTDVRAYYHGGSAKLDAEFSRDTQITNNFFIRTGIRSILATKTVVQNEIGSGLNQMRYMIRPYYRLVPGINIFTDTAQCHAGKISITPVFNLNVSRSSNVMSLACFKRHSFMAISNAFISRSRVERLFKFKAT